MRVDVCFTTEELLYADLKNSHVVMVDVLRASTTITTALAAGASGIWPVGTPGEARKLHAERNALTGGERHGLALPGFDFGNSPSEYTAHAVAGRWIALSTTNGTRALLVATSAAAVWVGCFNNFQAIIEGIDYCSPHALVISCAGTEGGTRVAAEDVLFAGMLVDRLARSDECLTDGARMARDFFRAQGEVPLRETMSSLRAGQILREMGLDADIDHASQLNLYSGIPRCEMTGLAWPLSAITYWER